jgi:hypothetical protein
MIDYLSQIEFQKFAEGYVGLGKALDGPCE